MWGDVFRMLLLDAVEREVAESPRRMSQQATGAVAALLASEPRAEHPDAEQDPWAMEVFGALLSGAVQSLALWWDDHRDVPREELVTRVMEFAWLGFERLRAGERF